MLPNCTWPSISPSILSASCTPLLQEILVANYRHAVAHDIQRHASLNPVVRCQRRLLPPHLAMLILPVRGTAPVRFAKLFFFFWQRFLGPFPGVFLRFSDTTSFCSKSFLHCTWTIHLYGDLNGGGHHFRRINLAIGVPDEAVVLVLRCRETETWISYDSSIVSFAIKHRTDRCTAYNGHITGVTEMLSWTLQVDSALIDRKFVY